MTYWSKTSLLLWWKPQVSINNICTSWPTERRHDFFCPPAGKLRMMTVPDSVSTWLKPRIWWFDPPREHFNKDIRIKLTLTTDREDSWETISLFSLEINCIGVRSIAWRDLNSGFGGKFSCQVNPGSQWSQVAAADLARLGAEMNAFFGRLNFWQLIVMGYWVGEGASEWKLMMIFYSNKSFAFMLAAVTVWCL